MPSRKPASINHQRRGVAAADPRYRRQPAGGFVHPCLGHELGIEGRDPIVEHLPLLTEIADQLPNAGAQARCRVGDNAGQFLVQLAAPLRHGDAAFQQHRPQVVDERGAFGHQPFPRPMQRLHVRLRLALHLDEAHRRPRRRFRDRLGVPLIVLLCLDVGTHVFRRHQPNLVPLRRQLPPQMMSAAARFHRHHARGPLPKPTKLQTFLPKSIPRTTISIGPLLSLSQRSAIISGSLREGRAIP
jgi:hypothetical protein